jgi:hypothetical protein
MTVSVHRILALAGFEVKKPDIKIAPLLNRMNFS